MLKRIQADFDERAMERLLWLMHRTEAASYAETLKNSLRFYKLLLEQVDAGGQIIIRDKKGNEKEILPI